MAQGNAGDQAPNRTAKIHGIVSDKQFYPRELSYFEAPLEEMVKKWVTRGMGPAEPVFVKGDHILTIGSCFADHLRIHLKKVNGEDMDYIGVPSYVNNTFALRQFLQWVATGERPEGAHKYSAGAVDFEDSHERLKFKETFEKAKGLVLTLGLAEIWCSKEGAVFWRGLPMAETKTHLEECSFRVSTVAENLANLEATMEYVRMLMPDATVVITLSPVPLTATFLDRPPMISDCVSKSILRVAIEEFFNVTQDANVYYWPAFEAVRWLASHIPLLTLSDNHSTRHANPEVVRVVIEAFVKRFFKNVPA